MSKWYEEVDSNISISGLEQGDILKGVNLYGYQSPGEDITLPPTNTFMQATVIILTQTCDLVNGPEKLPPGILVSIASDIDDLFELEDPLVISGSVDKHLESNNHPRLMLLPPLENTFNWHIIDFGDVHRIDKSFYLDNQLAPNLHLRLTSPARENVSQMFARHIMRVALNEELFGYADMIKKRKREIKKMKETT